MKRDAVIAHFAEQGRICTEYGSPFTGQLIERLGEDIASGGPTVEIVGDWPTDPRMDVLALRMAGALHAAVLTGRDAALAAQYPAQRPDWRVAEAWPPARAYLAREADEVRDFIRLPPQTNEVRRAIALAAGFLHFARDWSGPIDTLELGASAGLNVNWDRFHFITSSWQWGDPQSPVRVDTDWTGPPPPLAPVNVRDRAACDLNPLDVREPDQLLRLRSYIWADQADRLARFDGAVALAGDVRIDRADAAAWIARKLAARAKDAATVVYHSIFLQYPPPDARKAIVGAIEAAGAEAKAHAPLAWISLEPEAMSGIGSGTRFVISLTTWPGGVRRVIGYTDGHVRAIDAV